MNETRRKLLQWTVPVVTAIVLPVSSLAANSSGASIGKELRKSTEHLEKKFRHLFRRERDGD